MTGRNGEAACEGMLAELRKKHTVKSSQPLPARSTVGIVLEGTVVNIIVPGSPVTISVLKKDSQEPVHFKLTR